MPSVLVVGLGGFLGAIARYLASMAVGHVSSVFPYATLLVNFLGSMAIGFVPALTQAMPNAAQFQLFFVTGLLGAFTTFSAFSIETLRLYESGAVLVALLNVALNILLGLGGARAGLWFGERLF